MLDIVWCFDTLLWSARVTICQGCKKMGSLEPGCQEISQSRRVISCFSRKSLYIGNILNRILRIQGNQTYFPGLIVVTHYGDTLWQPTTVIYCGGLWGHLVKYRDLCWPVNWCECLFTCDECKETWQDLTSLTWVGYDRKEWEKKLFVVEICW